MWQYDRSFPETHLTAQAIEDNGKLLLLRSLNIKRAIAFVGSGVSVAYGRYSWRDLVEDLKKEVLQNLNLRTGNPLSVQQKELEKTLQYLSPASDDSSGETLLLILQLSEQLDNTLPPNKQINIRKRVKEFTRDNTAWLHHVEQIFAERFRTATSPQHAISPDEVDTKQQQMHEVSATGAPLSASSTSSASLFSIFTLKHLLQQITLPKTCENLDLYLQDCIKRNHESSEDVRYFVTALLALATTQDRDVRNLLPATSATVSSVLDPRPKSDPVGVLYDTLRIRRFLTTNYDFELEKYLIFQGFPKTLLMPVADVGETFSWLKDDDRAPGQPTVTNHLGETARSIAHTKTLHREELSAEMVGFAIGIGHYKAEIFHLHGRAGPDDDLVATEQDYQNTYLRSDESRRAFDEGLRAIFAGNCIVFVGLGMEEDDILRPLRQFVSDRALHQNYSLIAILPSKASRKSTLSPQAERSAVSLRLFSRYGIHVIFYGLNNSEKLDSEFYDNLSLVTEKTDDILTALTSNNPENTNSLDEYRTILRSTPVLHHMKELGLEHDLSAILALDYSPRLRHEKNNELLNLLFSQFQQRLRTAELCYKLRSLEKERDGWWREWHLAPDVRSVIPQLIPIIAPYQHRIFQQIKRLAQRSALHQDITTLAVRHRLVPHDREAPIATSTEATDRVKILLNYLKTSGEFSAISRPSRYLPPICVIGPRGSSKGQFFTDLQTHFFSQRKSFNNRYHYTNRYFGNTSFSCELSSLIDGVIDFLCHATRHEVTDGGISAAASESRVDEKRVKLFEAMLASAALTLYRRRQRILICISGIDIFFDDDNLPKTSEFERFIAALFAHTGMQSPIDLIVTCDAQRYYDIFAPEKDTGRQTGLPQVRGEIYHAIVTARGLSSQPVEPQERLDKTASRYPIILYALPEINFRNVIHRIFPELTLLFAGFNGLHPPDGLWSGDVTIATRLNEFLNAIQNNRFLGTVALQCISEIKVSSDRCHASDDIDNLLDSLRDAAMSSRERRDISVLERVFLFYKQRHDSLPQFAEGRYESKLTNVSSGLEFPVWQNGKLQEIVLKHLAVFSLPTQGAVLLRCPEVRALLQDIHKQVYGEAQDADFDARMHVYKIWLGRCLISLTNRFLVFMLHPRGNTQFNYHLRTHKDILIYAEENIQRCGFDELLDHRFALHSSVRRFIFDRMNAVALETNQGNFFTVSVYLGQHRDLPLPSPSLHGFVQGLLDDLIGLSGDFPTTRPFLRVDERSDLKTDHEPANWLIHQADLPHICRALLGVIRSMYSISVVSRLAEFKDSRAKKAAWGIFERYRLYLRRLLHFAQSWTIAQRDADLKSDNPFYLDEIIWLYNECALAAYVQGNLYDSAPLYAEALKLIGHQAPDSTCAATWVRVSLNRCLLDIDRGNFERARRTLENIQSRVHEGRRMRAFAKGILAVVQKAEGRLDIAERNFEIAREVLDQERRLRANSYLARHIAELYWRQRNWLAAEKQLRAAISLGEAGGHRDILHFAQLAYIRLQTRHKASDTNGDAVNFSYLLAGIAATEHYADRMELPKLKVEALRVKAEILMRQGESEHAGKLAVEALGLANLHGLHVWRIMLLNLIGAIMVRRGNYLAAKVIFRIASAAAHGQSFAVEAERAERNLNRLPDTSV